MMLDKPIVVPIAFIVGGIAILVIERYAQRPRIKSVDDIDWKTALFVGFCQCLAMIPGVSRSGATIMGARVFRVDRASSAEFSFFLAIPTMLGATVYDLYKNWKTLDWQGGGLIAIGFVVAFLSALVVIKPFLRFVSRHGFGVFAWYRIAVGALALVLLAHALSLLRSRVACHKPRKQNRIFRSTCMQRRKFIRTAGIGAAASGRHGRGGRARHRAVGARAQLAHDLELPQVARHALWRRRALRQDRGRGDRQQVPDPHLRGR